VARADRALEDIPEVVGSVGGSKVAEEITVHFTVE
jgi:hypothetical protein